MKTFLKGVSSPKNSSFLYISEESSHTVVSSGKTDSRLTRLSPSLPVFSSDMSGIIPAFSTSSFESWVLQSNTWIFSTSSPKNDNLYGLLEEKEKISIMEPRTANCPGRETKSVFSNPSPNNLSFISSWEISWPFSIVKVRSDTARLLPYRFVKCDTSIKVLPPCWYDMRVPRRFKKTSPEGAFRLSVIERYRI